MLFHLLFTGLISVSLSELESAVCTICFLSHLLMPLSPVLSKDPGATGYLSHTSKLHGNCFYFFPY